MARNPSHRTTSPRVRVRVSCCGGEEGVADVVRTTTAAPAVRVALKTGFEEGKSHPQGFAFDVCQVFALLKALVALARSLESFNDSFSAI